VKGKGSGLRHVSFHPTARFVYLICQDAGEILVFEWDDVLGSLTERQIVATVPDDFRGDPAASEIQVHPSGEFLYASNRGHNSIVIFRIDQSSGLLHQVGDQPSLGLTPRNFALTPCGLLLLVANQDSDQVVVFRIDPESGLLHELHSQAMPTPVCIVCGG
jgi:6-phosphogluconolactonase